MPHRVRDDRVGMLFIALSAVCFGSLAIFGKLGSRERIPLSELLGLRFGLAAVLLWTLLLLRHEPLWQGWRRGLGMATMGGLYAAQATAYFASLRTVPAGVTSILLYSYPVLVTMLARLFLGEVVTASRGLALLIALVGVFLIVNPLGGGGHLDSAGVGFGLASAVVYATYIVAGPRLLGTASAPLATAYIATVAGLCFLSVAAATGSVRSLDLGGATLIVGMAVVATVIPASLFLAGLGRIGPTRAAILSTLEPATTVLLAGALLGETLGPVQLFGGAAVLAGALLIAASALPALAEPSVRE